MLGTIVNCITVLIGGSIGLLLRRGLPERLGDTVMKGLALCVLYIGISGALEGQNVLIAILSIALGGLIGALLKIEDRIEWLGDKLEKKFAGKGGAGQFAHGFVSASLLFCVGSMTIVGALQSGLNGNHETLFAKSLIDGIAAIVLAASFGTGVLASAVFVLAYQGGITLLSSAVAPFLSEQVIAEMTCVGSLLIIGIALKMLDIVKLKLADYIPAIFLPILFCPLFSLFG